MRTPELLSIRNLHLGYKAKPVLWIPELDIQRGQVYFLIGKSGIGKSTFLEAIGLMTNSFIPIAESNCTYFKNGKESSVDLYSLWNETDAISKFRAEEFSFVFQNNNLLPSLSAGENMCIGSLIDRRNFEDVKKEVLKSMEILDLPEHVFDRKVEELSGGQRQRIAFIRALKAQYNLLLCDEPTGNLDQELSHKAMTYLRQNIKEQNKTAIIVSHDIDLAIRFADQILFIVEDVEKDNQIGMTSNFTKYVKLGHDWEESSEYPIEKDLYSSLASKLK